jgi:hypothetical protein
MMTLKKGSFFALTTKVIFSRFFNYFAFIVKNHNQNKIKIKYFYYELFFSVFSHFFSGSKPMLFYKISNSHFSHAKSHFTIKPLK